MEEPTIHTPPSPAAAPVLRGTRRTYDINILPQRYRRKKVTPLIALPWLILILLLGTFYPTYQLALKTQEDFKAARLELAKVQANLDFFQVNNQERENLQTGLEAALQERDAVLASYGGLKLSSGRWSAALFDIQSAVPPGITLQAISRQESNYRIEGTAEQYQQVIDFSDALKELSELAGVKIDFIEQIKVEGIAPPAAGNPEELPVGTGETLTYGFTILFTSAGEVLP